MIIKYKRQNPQYNYTLNGEALENVDNERDIGIKITANLKPSEHCQEAVGKARSVLGQISRCFSQTVHAICAATSGICQFSLVSMAHSRYFSITTSAEQSNWYDIWHPSQRLSR